MGTFDSIFADEPVKGKFADDVVARVRTGHALKGRPVALGHFRFTSADPDVIQILAEEFGGEAQEWDNEKEPLECFSTADSLNVIFDDPSSVTAGMIMFSRTNALLRACNTKTITGGDEEGHACKCAFDLAGRKEAAVKGTGCNPNVGLVFRLDGLPSLGKLRLNSGSWGLAADIGKVEAALARIDGPARGRVWLELVEWLDKRTGKERSFFKLHVDILGPVADVKSPF